jgi:hypothetical protein
MLEPYAPAGLDRIRPEFRDPADPPHWVGIDTWFSAFCANTVELEAKGLPVPTSWADLIKPEYEGLIAMPNPASSGTGFLSVSAILQMMGEEEGWAYLDKLHENMGVYTHSGSAPCVMAAKGERVAGISLDIGKTPSPLTLWAMQLGYTIPELMSSQQIGRPIDTQKYEGLKLKYQMDIDEQVYIGDTSLGVKGLLNSSLVTAEDPIASSGAGGAVDWSTKLAAGQTLAVLNDVNKLLNACWASSGYAVCPDSLLLPPAQYSALQVPVTSAGSISIMEYISKNSLSNSINGKPLRIDPVKWLYQRGASTKDRAVAYTKDKNRVRFPLVPLQRTPLEYRGIHQMTTYYGRIGVVEFVYPETVRYMDGI